MPVGPAAVAIHLADPQAGAFRLPALTICLICCLLAGCTLGQPQVEYELITSEEQSLSDIAAVPLSFTLASEHQKHAWVRALLFFKKYTDRMDLKSQGGTHPREHVTNSGSAKATYVYKVEKTPGRKGSANFVVSCTPSQRTAASLAGAERNARNLARFIRDGILEEDLVVVGSERRTPSLIL